MGTRLWLRVLGGCCAAVTALGAAPDAAALRLVPFPKEVALAAGEFALPATGTMTLTVGADAPGLGVVVADLAQELAVAAPGVRNTLQAKSPAPPFLWFTWEAGSRPVTDPTAAMPAPPEAGWGDGYALVVAPDCVVGTARALPGLANALRTLNQLLRANRHGAAIPALSIRDWPALRYRGYQDDMTRGPSSTLSFLQEELDLGAAAKMNLFTYYMEHQFAFAKHPLIGLPEDNGGLGPGELRDLVAAARARHIDVLGCQQSFGHSWNILRHKEYEHLRETPGILDPTNEETYRLLDDLYREQTALLPFPFFNVCCDETEGLGTGPSAKLAAQIGVGGVYARHMARLHRLLKENHGKRMMMWGDIILRHPENLKEIPPDTLMLTWGYSPRPDFSDQIEPFRASGFEFLVCPGVNGWSRILPDFADATVNIRNFLRDGAAMGALGAINTTWDDDGENLGGAHWHGFLWGAECAWNGGATTPEDFNRRVGAIAFREAGDHFGQAVQCLGQAASLPGLDGMMDRRFWKLDTAECPVAEPVTRSQAAAILAAVNPAVEHLRALKAEASANVHAAEVMLFGAERLQLIGERMTVMLDVARAAELAVRGELTPAQARQRTIEPLRDLRRRHADLRERYVALWNHENEPYALDRVLARYDALLARYDAMLARLEETLRVLDANAAEARAATAAGRPAKLQPLPSLGAVGLVLCELGVRALRPEAVAATPLDAALPWAAPATSRMGLTVRWPAGLPAGVSVPIQVALPAAALPAGRSARLLRLAGTEASAPVLCQVETVRGEAVLSFLASRTEGSAADSFVLYAAPGTEPGPPPPGAALVSTEPSGMVRLQNDRVSLLLGSEGGHIYEWKVTAAGGLDLTQPGTTDWAGFADLLGPLRNAPHRLEVLQAGPAVGRVRATAPNGLTKDFLLGAGQGWAEVILSIGTNWFWDYDAAPVFAPEGPQPGTFLFSDGFSGAVGPVAAATQAQIRRDGVCWAAKTRPDGLTHALLTPDVRTRLVTGPGGGWGGCGLEFAGEAAHFLIVGDVLAGERPAALTALAKALSLHEQPRVTLHGVEAQP